MRAVTIGQGICTVDGCSNINDGRKGLCGEHYRRFRSFGTFEPLRRPKGKHQCSVEGCTNLDDGGLSLCRLHYMRNRNHGHTGKVRKGNKRNHPFYALWFDRKTNKCLAPEWLDFDRFVADISPKPDGHYFLVRPRRQPYGPTNFEWREHLKRKPGEPRKEWWARKWAARQKAFPSMERTRELKRKYGITIDDYEAKFTEQNGVCAICKRAEAAVDPKTATIKRLAVDHCHESGKIRGLLCWTCNTVLGKTNESTKLLEAMIAYIKHHHPERKET